MRKLREIFGKASGSQKRIALGSLMAMSLMTGSLLAFPKENVDSSHVKTKNTQTKTAPVTPVKVSPLPTAAAVPETIESLVAKADIEKGRVAAQVCAGCHSLGKGQSDGFGPNLWNVVNRSHAQQKDYRYSASMMAQKDKKWGNEELNRFLTSPAKEVPGTKMPFMGIGDAQIRANIIAYLHTQADAPAPVIVIAPAEPLPVTVAVPPPPPKPFKELFAAADVKKGRAAAEVCVGCHSFEKNQPNRFGPNLWNVINSTYANKNDYNYSSGLQSRKGKKLDNEELNRFLSGPSPDTRMLPFPGVKDPQTRANIVAYLGTLSDTPAPALQKPAKVKVPAQKK